MPWCARRHRSESLPWVRYLSIRNRYPDTTLTVEQVALIMGRPCCYCGADGDVDLDRLDPCGRYEYANCAACCWPCNRMRGRTELALLHARVAHLAARFAGRRLRRVADVHFERSRTTRFSTYRRDGGARFKLSRAEFEVLFHGTCVYCGTQDARGIDRIRAGGMYSVANCASCCKTCNLMRGDAPVAVFRARILRMAAHRRRAAPAQTYAPRAWRQPVARRTRQSRAGQDSGRRGDTCERKEAVARMQACMGHITQDVADQRVREAVRALVTGAVVQ